MANRFILNETSYFGAGSREVIAGEIAKRGYNKAFIVADKDLIKFGIVELVTNALNGFPYEIFSDFKANPTVTNVKAGVEAYKASGADFIIAIGGGSAIDTSKAIAIIINNPEFSDVVSLEGVADTKNKCVDIIALPTTAGTAAEVTINYVITDEESGRKMVCVDPNDIPVLAIVDAELMSTMPASLTAATGMDALTHAIEGYITKGAWELSNILEINAIKIISDNLRKATFDGSNKRAREQMALGQYVAGMAFSNVGLGCVHSMAHPLGARFDIPHGVANALLLPIVMEYNMPACEAKYCRIATAMGVDVSNMSVSEGAKAAVEAVKQLSIDLKIPQTLREINIPEEALEQLANDAFNDVCTGGNPREITEADILELYKKAY
ncbi:MAG: lactaldehyde reductase [Clostridia bacterium]|nr:lactaldehyde reductase [Clostridia bacterium]MBQ7789340.1 lactaldehyde reductase [Clostridia bacterium]